jgi:hypothetical protein
MKKEEISEYEKWVDICHKVINDAFIEKIHVEETIEYLISKFELKDK